ncbi:MAG TPA: family 10 glycosylhydrolase [Phycisphaerae bacterium]|nr:family 10 glycosylhydrolase [Phycisphaerae bacterium]
MRRLVCAGIVLMSLSAGPVVAENAPEFRAAWVTRFDWTDQDPERCRAKILEAFEILSAANMNAVVFQIRGEAETLYPSELEPWSELLGGKDPGFDPAALAIAEAHKRGIQFHAYINAMPLRSMRFRNPPAAPNHLWHTHGPGSAEPWVCMDAQGRPSREEYYYLSPSVPGVQAYLRKVILDVVRRYEVDGIHLDRVRYPGPEYVYNPISDRRFYGRGNPTLRDRADWHREQLDKFINDLAAEIREVRPACVLSCSAWGIYDRHNLPEYGDFSSGYHDYYQDTWNWCRLGAMDLLMPMIYWNIPDPKPNYDELLKDFIRGVGGEHVVGGQSVFSADENARQVQVSREAGAAGTVLFTAGRAQRRGVLARLKETLYPTPAPVPKPKRVVEPTTGCILGTVTTEAGTPLVDAWVSWTPIREANAQEAGQDASSSTGNRRSRRGGPRQMWTSSADGRFAFLEVPPGQVKVRVEYPGAAAVESGPVEVKAGQVTRVEVAVSGSEQLRDLPFLAVMAPGKKHETTAEVVHILGRTWPDCQVRVGDKAVEVFSTGAFARDNVPLSPGENKIRITATDTAGRVFSEELLIVRRAESPTTPAQPAATQPAAESQLVAVEATDRSVPRVGEAARNGVAITYGLHTVRLGGPYLGRIPKGTRFEVLGRQGRNLKIGLSRSLSGFIDRDDVSLLPEGTPVPHNYFLSCDIDGNEECDRVSIRLREKVVFAVRSETSPSNRLYVDFFNTHHAATWISHKSGARITGPVTVEQIEDDRVRLTIPLNCKQIWGYWTEVEGETFNLFIRRPPQFAAPPASPLKGLLFALEAGHGGRTNNGAVGHMGTKEKVINAMAVEELRKALEARGAQTVLVRPGDSSPSLQERVDQANAAGAHFFIAMHANAAGNARGYLTISGTSTYYLDKHCYLAADLVYRRLLGLGWKEFGVVGNFSYYPLQNTRVPAILVEQAFMSNPSDEARMLDPAYQQRQAEAIVEGLEQFIAQVRE